MYMKCEELEYEFEIEVPVGTPDYFSGDVEYRTETVNVIYPADVEEIKSYLYELLDSKVQTADLENYINSNYDKLFKIHYDDIKDYFEEKAKEWA